MSDSKPLRNGLVIMTDTPTKKPRKPLTKKAQKEIKQAKKARAAAPKRDLEDIKNEEPIAGEPSAAINRGRPKKSNYISYADAREFVRGELIPSRKRYLEWWERNKPKSIPRFPYRVYAKDWTSWNDYLGNANEFGLRVANNWRPLEEAALWVHSLKIESYTKWMEYCKENTLPEDIPARPDLVYSGWKTWNHWLGNRPMEALDVRKEAMKHQIYYIYHIPGTPENVFNFRLESMGQAALKERWEREQFTFVRLFWFDPEQAGQVQKIVESLSTPYLGDDKQRVCQNIWEINYYLELTLQRIVRF